MAAEATQDIDRPNPPEHLSHGAAEEWRAIVARRPPRWMIRENFGLFESYCEAVAESRLHGAAITAEYARAEECKGQNGAGLDLRLLKDLRGMLSAANRDLRNAATSLRLTPHSQASKDKPAGNGVGAKPLGDL